MRCDSQYANLSLLQVYLERYRGGFVPWVRAYQRRHKGPAQQMDGNGRVYGRTQTVPAPTLGSTSVQSWRRRWFSDFADTAAFLVGNSDFDDRQFKFRIARSFDVPGMLRIGFVYYPDRIA